MSQNFLRASKNETLLQIIFYVATKILCRNTRHSCRDNYKTTSAELCRDIFKARRDRIQEESTNLCRDRKLQAKTKAVEQRRQLCRDIIFNVATKQPIGPYFLGSTILALKCSPSFENL